MADSGAATSAASESSLLSKLESSSDLSSIHHLFSSYLQPFSSILKNPKKRSKSTKIDAETTTTIRSLAKKFLSFISKSLTLLPKRLNETPKIDPRYALELFETYTLCISCLEAVSSQLSCKPHHVQIQRVRLIHCYEYWGRYNDAQIEGLSVLEFIGNMSGKQNGKIVGRVVPELGKENEDKDVALLVLEVVVSLVKCVANARSKKEEDYRRVFMMINEIEPWLRVIDPDSYEKLHKLLVTYLNKCTLFVVGEFAISDGNLARRFCDVTFKEYRRLSVNDQTLKFGRRICSLIFSELGNQLLSNVDILTCVLDNMAKECKIGKETAIVDFLEIADYCAHKCRIATVNICGAVAIHFVKLAGDFSQVNLSVDKIMRLYAITLSMSDLSCYSRGCNSKMPKAENDKSISQLLLDLEDELQSLTTAHGSVTILATDMGSYMSFCFNALKFLCEPLSELIISERKNILCGYEDISLSIRLPNIEDAFHQFRLNFLRASEKEIDVYEDNSRTILAIAIAAFTLSFTTKQGAKESVSFIKHLISEDWGQANGLKYLYASLHNVGIVLYRANRLKEATKSFKLCCQAAWKCILHVCEVSASSKDEPSSDLSEDSIAAFVTEACSKSTFLLDILYQCGSKKISRTLTDSLRSWSVAQNLFDKIPSPVALVKQWVKIKCKETKDPEARHTVPTINLLLSSSEMSKETLGILLEQELQAYKEMKSLNPELSKIMQTTITKILLEEIYTTKVSCLQKFRILIANARESRACGVEGLNDCLQNLSEAISSMNDLCSKDKEYSSPVCQLLAEAYCLRALCTQEVEPNSKLSSQDIGIALKLWLSQEHSQSAEQIHMACPNTITLLYHVVDLLSLKGYMENHSDIYEMLIRFITQKSVPLKECLAMLWQSRSLNHALCTSPVNDAFIVTLSKHCNLSMSMEFWKSCMERSKLLEVGFSHSLSVISTLSTPDSYNSEHATQTHAAIDEVKKAASDLISTVPLSSKSLFLTAYLYYDLSEGLIARGLIIEALSYAKEAHRLRIKLLKKHFAYSIEQHDEIIDGNGEVIQKRGYGLKTFHMHSSVATIAWSCDKGSSEFEDFILTPWNVLRCYLESILQVGTIQEMVGNGHEAEALLLWGKNISCFQCLPIFLVSFSASLGKLYRKQRLWHLAEKELESAKHVLVDSGTLISCSKCKLILEVTVGQQLGDLFRSRFSNTTGNKLQEELSNAEIIYRIAADKLKLSEWKNCISNPKETSSRKTMFCDSVLIGGNDGSNLSSCANLAEQKAIQPKVTRKGRKTVKSLPQEQRVTSRVTRSSKQKNECAQSEVQNAVEGKQLYACDDALIGKGTQKSKVFSLGACGCKVACVCDDVNCWHCLPTGIMKSKSLRSIIQMKWECTRRRFLLRLLIGIGKCLGGRSETHRAHEVFLEGISMMVSRSTLCTSHFPLSFTFLANLIERNVTGDVFAVEQASIFYNICWFSLKSSSNKATRNQCCDMSFIPIPIVVSGLKLSFILCREVPELFQKVSRLLALLYTLAPLNETFSMLPSSSNTLSESQLASYFHQVSLGTHLTYQLFSRLGRKNDESTMDVDDLCLLSSSFLSLHRLAPQSVLDLEEFILNFFKGLPCVTIVCISMLGDGYASWLRELLPYNHSTRACVMFSRMNSDSAPVVIVLPVDPILSGSSKDDEDSSSSILFDKRSSDKLWCCPWGQSIIDEVVPLFRTILEENYLSSSGYTLEEDTKQNRSLWWNQRRKLDQWLSDLLRDVESLWFGPWKHFLLGELSDHKHLDSVQKKLMKDLKSKCKVDVHEDIIKTVIGGGVHASQQEECLSEVFLKKGCYIGGRGCRSPGEYSNSLSSVVSELILNAIQEIGDEDVVDREPVILVPDFDIQMLPWESLPILRNQEVYRMPSVASISCTYDRCCHLQEKIGKDSAVYPMIDPLDAYYLLNPGGDLCSTEAEFGNWFKDQNLEGTAGTSPSVDELSVALKNHDLFIYLGHGSGIQYIPGGEIQKLDKCAATLLMGCSSGSLSLNGPYTPKGAPLYYIFAGSPVIIANLWDVTDKDIDRFGKTMLDAWIKARSTTSVDCEQCTEISDKLEDLNIDGCKRKANKRASRSISAELSVVNTSASGCKHRPKIGSFMGQARGACTLPFLIGAAPVCYGVPTGIQKKKL